jgi:F-type H+-transporting ATPase subunit epsilon
MERIDLEIVTPKGRALKETVDEVTAPSVEGEFGVLPGHVPLVAALRSGIVSYRIGADVKRVAVGAGFAEAGPNKVVILTDEYVERDKIDPVLVRRDLAEVQTAIAKAATTSTTGADGSPMTESLAGLIRRENWLAAELELHGDPPPATMRPFEAYGPPAPDADEDIPTDPPTS